MAKHDGAPPVRRVAARSGTSHARARREPGDPNTPFSRAPEHLVAVDPGVRKCGLAYFYRGELREATTLERPSSEDVVRWLEAHEVPLPVATFVRERMQYYPHEPAKHTNLDAVEDWADALANHLGIAWARVWYASVWKGPIPKHIHHIRLATHLTAPERWVWSHPGTGEDGRDAIGIGLYATRRARKLGL